MTLIERAQNDDLAIQILHYIDELAALKDIDAILDRILFRARELTRADAGSIFLVQEDKLVFSYVHNDTLFNHQHPHKAMYEAFSVSIDEASIVGFAAKTGQTVVIDDAYALALDLPYHFNPSYDDASGYRTTSMLTIPLRSVQGRLVGVMQIINAKDFQGHAVPFGHEAQTYLPLLASAAAAAIERGVMTREMILRMMKMAELRDPKETGAHVQRVAAYSAEIYKSWALSRIERGELIASETDDRPMEDAATEIRRNADLIRLAAMLHDVGKVGIPDAILKKPDKLTDDEYQAMKWHTVLGARLFANATSELDQMCYEIALGHHERWDGNGYPGLDKDLLVFDPAKATPRGGPSIPLAARITALADVYDALGSRRSYKQPWPEDKVTAIIEQESGHQFDPEVVTAFFKIYDVILAIRHRFSQPEDSAD